MNWIDKKRIGEALGYESERDIDNCYYFGGATKGYSTLEGLWDAYQPDVLEEVIPWLEKNADTPSFEWYTASPRQWLPLAILEAEVAE